MKKISALITALLMTVIFAFGTINAGAVGATTGEVDVIFLVDSSRSMAKSDPGLIRLEAIKLFADLCSFGSTKIGFVLFGSEINYSQEPVAIDTEEDRQKIKDTVDGLTDLAGSTDIGMAVKYSAEMLASDEFGGSGKFIVFLSDGKTVISGGDGTRTIEDSQADLESGIKTAQDAGIPIYTVGLNANGDVDFDELLHISSSTYADLPYMTDSASDLSEILSEIYVRHTGAETSTVSSFVSDGEYKDVPFEISDNSVVEANIVIMHEGGLDHAKLTDPDGTEITFDGTQADISHSDGYSLMKVYSPKSGTWTLSVKSPKDTQVEVNYILTRDYSLSFTVFTDKAVDAGTKLKLSAVLTGIDGNPVENGSMVSKLAGRVILKNEATGASEEIALSYSDGAFRHEYTLPESGTYTLQASLYNTNIDIRSDIVRLAPGDEQFIEPEGPLKMIIICSVAGIALIVALVIAIKKYKQNIRMYSGRLVITVSTDGVPTMPAPYDFAKKVPGKRKVLLSDVLKALPDSSAADAIPKSITSGITITMADSGDIRLKKVKGLEYSGGITLGDKVVLSNANRLTLRYTDKNSGTNNAVVIQYMRT